MDLILLESKAPFRAACKKKGVPVVLKKEQLEILLNGGQRKVDGFLISGMVQIFDVEVAEILHDLAGLGHYLDDSRYEKTMVSESCLPEVDECKKWADLRPDVKTLVLEPEEAIFLALDWRILTIKIGEQAVDNDELWTKLQELNSTNWQEFMKKVAVFRHLRNSGWIVRNGLMFGCQFLIYCLGTQYFHSSAGVLISDKIDPLQLLGLTRILSHNKKGLVLATCNLPENCENRFEDMKRIEVQTVTMKSFFLERQVPTLSSKPNSCFDIS